MLAIYPVIIETLKEIAPLAREIAKHDVDLARQLRRAGSSIALNAAEGEGLDAGNRRQRFRTALGSAKETCACLDVAAVWSYIEPIDARLADRLDRVRATLFRLGH